MKRCTRCVLPETFPGIHFNTEGICNFCIDFKSSEDEEKIKKEYRKKFEALIMEYKGIEKYDVLMCYSGGKDSTYTLKVIKEEYRLNILAITFDNGFLSDQAVKNIHTIVENLGIDHILFKPRFDMLKKIFIESIFI